MAFKFCWWKMNKLEEIKKNAQEYTTEKLSQKKILGKIIFVANSVLIGNEHVYGIINTIRNYKKEQDLKIFIKTISSFRGVRDGIEQHIEDNVFKEKF
jgi:hypothetical protein